MKRRYETMRLLHSIEDFTESGYIRTTLEKNASKKIIHKLLIDISQDPDDERLKQNLDEIIQFSKSDFEFFISFDEASAYKLLFEIKISEKTMEKWNEFFQLFEKTPKKNLNDNEKVYMAQNFYNFVVYTIWLKKYDVETEFFRFFVFKRNILIYKFMKMIAFRNKKNEDLLTLLLSINDEFFINIKAILGEDVPVDTQLDPEIYLYIDPHLKNNVSSLLYTKFFLCFLCIDSGYCTVCGRDIQHLLYYFKINTDVFKINVKDLFSSIILDRDIETLIFFCNHEPKFRTVDSLKIFIKEIMSGRNANEDIYSILNKFNFENDRICEDIICDFFSFILKQQNSINFEKGMRIFQHLQHTAKTFEAGFRMIFAFFIETNSTYLKLKIQNTIYLCRKTFDYFFPHIYSLQQTFDSKNLNFLKSISDLLCETLVATIDKYLHDIVFRLDHIEYNDIKEIYCKEDLEAYFLSGLTAKKQMSEQLKFLRMERDQVFRKHGTFIFAFVLMRSKESIEYFCDVFGCSIFDFINANSTKIFFDIKSIFCRSKVTNQICIFQIFQDVIDFLQNQIGSIIQTLTPFIEYFLTLKNAGYSCKQCNYKESCKRSFLNRFSFLIQSFSGNIFISQIRNFKILDDTIHFFNLKAGYSDSSNTKQELDTKIDFYPNLHISEKYKHINEQNFSNFSDHYSENGLINNFAGIISHFQSSLSFIVDNPISIFYLKNQNHLAINLLYKLFQKLQNQNLIGFLDNIIEAADIFCTSCNEPYNENYIFWFSIINILGFASICPDLYKMPKISADNSSRNNLKAPLFNSQRNTQNPRVFSKTDTYFKEAIENTLKDLSEEQTALFNYLQGIFDHMKHVDLKILAIQGLVKMKSDQIYKQKLEIFFKKIFYSTQQNKKQQDPLKSFIFGFFGHFHTIQSMHSSCMQIMPRESDLLLKEAINKILECIIDQFQIGNQDTYLYVIQETLQYVENSLDLTEKVNKFIAPFAVSNFKYKSKYYENREHRVDQSMRYKSFLLYLFQFSLTHLGEYHDIRFMKCIQLGGVLNTQILELYVELAMHIIFTLKLNDLSVFRRLIETHDIMKFERRIFEYILKINQICHYKLLDLKHILEPCLIYEKFHYLFRYCSQKEHIKQNGYDMLQFLYLVLEDYDSCLAIKNIRPTISKPGLLYELIAEKDFSTAKYLIDIYNKKTGNTEENINTPQESLHSIKSYSNYRNFSSDQFDNKSISSEIFQQKNESNDRIICNEQDKYKENDEKYVLKEIFSQKPTKGFADAHVSDVFSVNRLQNRSDMFIQMQEINIQEQFAKNDGVSSEFSTNKANLDVLDDFRHFNEEIFCIDHVIKKFTGNSTKSNVSEVLEKYYRYNQKKSIWDIAQIKNADRKACTYIFDAEVLSDSYFSDSSACIVTNRRKEIGLDANILESHKQIADFFTKYFNQSKNLPPPYDLKSSKKALKKFDDLLSYDYAKYYLKSNQINLFKAKITDMLLNGLVGGSYLFAKYKHRLNHTSEAQGEIKKLLSYLSKENVLFEKTLILNAKLQNTIEAFEEAEKHIKNSAKFHLVFGTFLEKHYPISSIDHLILSFNLSMKYRKTVFPKIIHILTEGLGKSESAKPIKPRLNLFEKCARKVESFFGSVNHSEIVCFFPTIASKLNHSNTHVSDVLFRCVQSLLESHSHQTIWDFMIVLNTNSKDLKEKVLRFHEKLSVALIKTIKSYCDLSQLFFRIANVETKNRDSFSLRQKFQIDGKILDKISIPNYANSVFIEKIIDEVRVFVSLQAPKKISFLASDGKNYGFLVKNNDDLRKDSKFMDLACLLNDIFSKDQACVGRNCKIQTYRVVPITSKSGIIEWVDGLATLRNILNDLYMGENKSISEEQAKHRRKKKIGIVDFHDTVSRFHPILPNYFLKFLDPVDFYLAKKQFTESCAVMSIVGWFMGLGDRHLDNIMINERDGSIFHVDLNCIFEKGTKLEVPEKVPFRLTQNITASFGPLGIDGLFIKTMMICIQAMKQNKEIIMANLLSLVYDPLPEMKIGKKTTEESSYILLNSISKKLEFEDSYLLCDKLIKEATNDVNLSDMFIGWCAFI